MGKRNYLHNSHGHVSPGLVGKVLFTGQGMFTKIGQNQFTPGRGFTSGNTSYPGSEANGCYVPAHHADYYLHLGNTPTGVGTEEFKGVAVHKLGVDKALLRVP